VPPRPKLSVILAARPATGTPPARVATALIAKGRALCAEDDEGSKLEESWPLGGNQFLHAFTCPDSSGAYNYRYGFLIATAGNSTTARAVKFTWPVKVGDCKPTRPDITTNPTFDPNHDA
jgi:hypothetical protein